MGNREIATANGDMAATHERSVAGNKSIIEGRWNAYRTS